MNEYWGGKLSEIDELKKQREELEKQIDELYRRDRMEAITTCRELIKRFDLQPAELGLKRIMKKGAAIPKYMGPSGETWAGRGRKPTWLQNAELEGKTAEDFRILPPITPSDEESGN